MLKDHAVYRFINEENGLTLSASVFGLSYFSSVAIVDEWAQELNQGWRLHLLEDGWCKLELLSSGKYLAVYKNSKKDGAAITVQNPSDSNAQKWRITEENGYVAITSYTSGLNLSLKEKENDSKIYVVQTAENTDHKDQWWKVVEVDDGTTEFPQMLNLKDPTIHTGCPEITKVGDTYVLLAWDNTESCSIRTSKNLTDWTDQRWVYSYHEGLPEPWMEELVPGGGMWCPGIYKIKDTWYVYYAVSGIYEQTSFIGCYSNKTLDSSSPDYEWVSCGPVIRSAVGDPYNCIDPCVVTDDDGTVWLVFGSAWTGIKMVKLNPENGMLLEPENPEIIGIASRVKGDRAIEAPYVIKRGDYWYLFAAVEVMVEGKYHNACGRAESITGPYYSRDGVDMMDGGVKGGSTSVTEGKDGIIMPGHASIFKDDDGTYYHVTEYWENSTATLRLGISTIVWDEEGWPWTSLSDRGLSRANGNID